MRTAKGQVGLPLTCTPVMYTRRDTFATISFLSNIVRFISHLSLPIPSPPRDTHTHMSTYCKPTKQDNPSAETRTVEGAVQIPHTVPPYLTSTYRYGFFV